jgi:hypothetical protein
MRTWVYSYIRTRDGDIIPWLERVEYYASRTVTDTVWTIDVYRYFPGRREQKSANEQDPKENKDEHTSNQASSS